MNPLLSKLAAALHSDLKGHDRGQSNLVGLIIGLTIAAVVAIAAAIPVISDVTVSANLSGTTATVVNLIPLFIGLLLLVAIASPLMSRV